jgi:hypothetical protein
MQIIKATWEKRNLGVDCNEIIIEADDSVEAISKEISKHETEYTVVKIPTGLDKLLLHLQKQGFLFIETITSCYHTGEQFNLNRIQQRIIDNVSYKRITNDDIELIFKEINNGLFQTDRVSLDQHFTLEQSNNRYIGWVKDELDRGAKAYTLTYNTKNVGFFTLKKQTEHEYFAFLSGIYSDFLSSGLGFCTHYFEVIEAKRQGAKHVNTVYSSNNRGATAIHLNMGHVLREQYYVLVKHKTKYQLT